jgi:hypothetical protein
MFNCKCHPGGLGLQLAVASCGLHLLMAIVFFPICNCWVGFSRSMLQRSVKVLSLVYLYLSMHKALTYQSSMWCREDLQVGDEVQIMPCSDHHVFHPPCLAPWLKDHNSCPVRLLSSRARPIDLPATQGPIHSMHGTYFSAPAPAGDGQHSVVFESCMQEEKTMMWTVAGLPA